MLRPHFYDVDYKTKWVKPYGGIGKDDRFKFMSVTRRLRDKSPGPTTAVQNENFSLPSIDRRN